MVDTIQNTCSRYFALNPEQFTYRVPVVQSGLGLGLLQQSGHDAHGDGLVGFRIAPLENHGGADSDLRRDFCVAPSRNNSPAVYRCQKPKLKKGIPPGSLTGDERYSSSLHTFENIPLVARRDGGKLIVIAEFEQ
ncbi:hypothetical protein CDAR_9151 [Caerostris darwini]|uniref:Uncharacterized protein n=1 Tax=Caerostris darwini TaxID=1538125 RepID=A0AAV4UYI8_9ARAC|nr:hypothetical protein CDAR_9151 [Caerostris darwini]